MASHRLIRPLIAAGSAAALALGLAVAAVAEPIRLIDGGGREIKLERSAERVAVLPITGASTFIAVDQSISRLISIHPRAKRTMMEGLLGRIYPGIADIPAPVENQGSDMSAPNAEAIAVLQPDLVLQSGHQGGETSGPLDRVGLKTALIRYGSEDAVRETLRIMAAAVGKPERAERMIAWRDAITADLAVRLRAIKSKPRVLYITNADGGYRASGGGNYNDYSIGLAGGLNAAAELAGAQLVTKEQILVWNPDIILLPSFGDRMSPQDVLNDPLLASTNAGQNRKVYKSPMGAYRWEAPAQENPFYWMWLANIMHPDMPPYDLRSQITDVYQWMYGYKVSAQDEDEMLQFDANAASSGYRAMMDRPQ
jgi:iron complex transport system substrate-binding protein